MLKLNTNRNMLGAWIGSLLLLFMMSCSSGGGSSSTTPAPSSSSSASLLGITVTATNTSIAKGTSLQFTAAGNYSDNTSKDITGSVTWSTSDSTKATVDNFGRVTAVAAGSATITATSDSISGSGTLTITSATLVSMTVTPASPSIANGTSQQFSVIGIYSDNTLQNLTSQATWSSSNTSTVTINSSGVASGLAAGTVTITATSGSVSATASLMVTNASLASLSVTPTNATVPMAGTTQLSASGSFSDGTSQDLTTQVTWLSSDTSKATVSARGVVTGIAAGSVTIKATSGNISSAVTVAISNPNAGSVQLSGTVQPDPADATAAGHQSGATVYVVGQQSNAVTTDNNGNFTLNVNPSLSGTVLAKPRTANKALSSANLVTEQTLSYGIIVIDSTGAHGVKSECLIVTDQANNCQTLYINTVGSISGHAYLQGQSDNSGITVYIPGTSFSAITASDGSYKISGVPSGTYDFVRAEKFGTTYHYALSSQVTVNTNQDTTIGDMVLQLSVGAFGGVIINNGAPFTNSATVNLSLAPSSDAVLMSVSDDSSFVNASWVPVQATYPFTFSPATGVVNVYVKFAQDNGLASDPTTTSIYLDTNPQATKIGPASVTMSTTPTLQWQYSAPMPSPQYHVQLTTSGDTSFSTPIVDQTNVSSPQYTVSSALSQTAYIWRVAIIYNGNQLSWGPTWSFTVDRTAGTLVSPADFSYTNNRTPTFTWSANSSASSYTFTLSTNSDLSSPVLNVPGITGSSYGPISQLPASPQQLYYWAVTPYDSTGNPGTRSAIGRFILDTSGPAGQTIGSGTGVVINNDDLFTALTGVTLTLKASDPSTVVAYYVQESTGTPATPSATAPGWHSVASNVNLSTTVAFTLSNNTGLKTVYVWFKDIVGNVSSAYPDSINLIDFTTNFENVDQGGNGGFPSLALYGSSANIIYIDEMNSTGVKYMTDYTGSWSWPTLLDNSPNGQTGSDHSIAVHGAGAVYMTFCDFSHTYFMYKPGMIRQSWTSVFTVDTMAGNTTWSLPSLVSDSTGTAYIAYMNNNQLSYAAVTSPSVGTVQLFGSIFANAIYGQSISMAIDTNNKLYISFLDTTDKTVKVITNAGGSWGAPTSIENINTTTSATSIAIGKNNSVNVIYKDSSNNLRFASSASGWTPSTIGTGVSTYSSFSLAVDSATDKAFVSFYGSGLRLATNAFGQWATASLDSTAQPINSSIALNGTSVHIAYYNGSGWQLQYTFANY